jgi:hypothetical protein
MSLSDIRRGRTLAIADTVGDAPYAGAATRLRPHRGSGTLRALAAGHGKEATMGNKRGERRIGGWRGRAAPANLSSR